MRTQANGACAVLIALLAVSVGSGCSRRSQPTTETQRQAPTPETKIAVTEPLPARAASPSPSPRAKTRTMYASWYDLPPESIAARRALPGELTAAHDHYRLGTRLRITHAGNGRSVIVRITDRGVPRGKAPLDLCKRAAEELDMISQGTAKVRVEVLPEEELAGAAPADSPSVAAQP